MEFISIATQNIECEPGAIQHELRSFINNAKHYNSFVSKCILHPHVFKASSCVICSLVNIALNNHYINEWNPVGSESKKLKSSNSNKQQVALKSPCLNQVGDNFVKVEDEGDKFACNGHAAVGEGNNMENIREYIDNMENKDETEKLCNENAEHEVDPDVLEKETTENEKMETDFIKINFHNKPSKKKRKRGKGKDNTFSCSLPAILKAPCLVTVERNDPFRRDIVNIVSFWFGYVGAFQVSSTVCQLIPRSRMGFSTIYEWVLFRRETHSTKVLIIPICALNESRLLLHQSFGLVLNDKEKTISAYIHKNFDMDVPHFCLVPSIGWITDVVLPKIKERAKLLPKVTERVESMESIELDPATTVSIDNNGEQSSI